MDELKLWENIYDILSEWITDHPHLFIEDVTDDIFDYVIDNYGPPF